MQRQESTATHVSRQESAAEAIANNGKKELAKYFITEAKALLKGGNPFDALVLFKQARELLPSDSPIMGLIDDKIADVEARCEGEERRQVWLVPLAPIRFTRFTRAFQRLVDEEINTALLSPAKNPLPGNVVRETNRRADPCFSKGYDDGEVDEENMAPVQTSNKPTSILSLASVSRSSIDSATFLQALNNADLKELCKYATIGKQIASKIIQCRSTSGPFESVQGVASVFCSLAKHSHFADRRPYPHWKVGKLGCCSKGEKLDSMRYKDCLYYTWLPLFCHPDNISVKLTQASRCGIYWYMCPYPIQSRHGRSLLSLALRRSRTLPNKFVLEENVHLERYVMIWAGSLHDIVHGSGVAFTSQGLEVLLKLVFRAQQVNVILIQYVIDVLEDMLADEAPTTCKVGSQIYRSNDGFNGVCNTDSNVSDTNFQVTTHNAHSLIWSEFALRTRYSSRP